MSGEWLFNPGASGDGLSVVDGFGLHDRIGGRVV